MTERLKVFGNIPSLREMLEGHRRAGESIGLVPTMGNLHAGHVSLLEAARRQSDVLVASIFINPMQFGPREDLSSYPRTFDDDCKVLQASGCNYLFAPEVEDIYPLGMAGQTVVSLPHISALHCGKSRPAHFDGVCTVVCKLFNIVQPDRAWFGLKDYQQFHIISRMVDDLNITVSLIGMPIIREDSGLAMSSRNGYLSAEEKHRATALYQSLQSAAASLARGQEFRLVERLAAEQLQDAGMKPDYFTVCDRNTLLPAQGQETRLVILAAAWISNTRLIDNLPLDL